MDRTFSWRHPLKCGLSSSPMVQHYAYHGPIRTHVEHARKTLLLLFGFAEVLRKATVFHQSRAVQNALHPARKSLGEHQEIRDTLNRLPWWMVVHAQESAYFPCRDRVLMAISLP